MLRDARRHLHAVIAVAGLATLVFHGTALAQQLQPLKTSGDGDGMTALEELHAQALSAYRAREPAKAVRLLEAALSDAEVSKLDPTGQNPKVTAILNDYGFFLAQAGLRERAIAVLESVVARTPDRAVAYLNLADAEHDQGQLETARNHYDRYAALMEGVGKVNKIPARVGERTGFTYAAKFVVTTASPTFDVMIRVAKCDRRSCSGSVSYAFHLKGNPRAFQVIRAPDTAFSLSKHSTPLVNEAELYGAQSAINVGDFNFDGLEDVALCTGNEGSYHSPSSTQPTSSSPSSTKMAAAGTSPGATPS